MNKQQICDELVAMADRLEAIQDECESLKGYVSGAAEVASLAVYHLIDLVISAEKVSE
jgi:hypothetical protein